MVLVLSWSPWCFNVVVGDSVRQQTTGLSKQKGDTVSLSCSYTTSSNYAALYWYRHHPGLATQYILYRHTNGVDNTADYAKGRFTSHLDKSQEQTTLIILNSAMHHCALSLHHSDTHHRKPRTITLITTKAGKQYSTVSDRECNKPSAKCHHSSHLVEVCQVS
uniref:Ig-like domain-containing protein n=1 Tax=Callorhinchus milii TaxID=7868 RepID=A0A4W3IY39_CALMI